mmetsp:Transcript_19305/g.32306  ORF Transcript_19305/g.32306 Transcript_19305/m.32306 type:complete len:201 (+) Transcript_19305:5856-6458(+)
MKGLVLFIATHLLYQRPSTRNGNLHFEPFETYPPFVLQGRGVGAGVFVGVCVGVLEGCMLGILVGSKVGETVGEADGALVGFKGQVFLLQEAHAIAAVFGSSFRFAKVSSKQNDPLCWENTQCSERENSASSSQFKSLKAMHGTPLLVVHIPQVIALQYPHLFLDVVFSASYIVFVEHHLVSFKGIVISPNGFLGYWFEP